jgi:hypothetical protein
MHHQHLANTNGIINPNISTRLLAPYLKANVAIIKIAWELVELLLIFRRVENVEIRRVSPALRQYQWHCQSQCIYLTVSTLPRS